VRRLRRHTDRSIRYVGRGEQRRGGEDGPDGRRPRQADAAVHDVLAGPGPYRVDSFAPVVEVGGARLDFDFGPRLEPRQAALGVLAAYTEVLAPSPGRTTGASWTERRTRSVEASSGWRSRHGVGGREARRGVLATAVNGLGHVIIERMRRAALRKAMDDAAPGIAAIVTFVKEINVLVPPPPPPCAIR